jgi:hypothetical protein
MDFHPGKTNRHISINPHVSLITEILAVTLDVGLIVGLNFRESSVLRDHVCYPAARWPLVGLPKDPIAERDDLFACVYNIHERPLFS